MTDFPALREAVAVEKYWNEAWTAAMLSTRDVMYPMKQAAWLASDAKKNLEASHD